MQDYCKHRKPEKICKKCQPDSPDKRTGSELKSQVARNAIADLVESLQERVDKHENKEMELVESAYENYKHDLDYFTRPDSENATLQAANEKLAEEVGRGKELLKDIFERVDLPVGIIGRIETHLKAKV